MSARANITDEELRKIEVDAAGFEVASSSHPRPAPAGRRALYEAGYDAADSDASNEGNTYWDGLMGGIGQTNPPTLERLYEAFDEAYYSHIPIITAQDYHEARADGIRAVLAVLALLVPTSKETSDDQRQ